MHYKPEGRGFDSNWCNWNHSGRTVAPGVDSASNRNEYKEYLLGGKSGRCVGLTTLPPSCVDCLEIWEPQSPGTLRVCPGFLELLLIYLIQGRTVNVCRQFVPQRFS